MSTLRKYQFDHRTVVQKAQMFFSSSGRQTVVVEGEADYRLFRQWLLEKNARIENANGKPQVKLVWEEAKKRGFSSIHCLADLDYDLVVSDQPIFDDQFIYVSLEGELATADAECNDIESALIRSHALSKVMSQKYRGRELYENFDVRINDLRERLRVASASIGAFRAADLRVLKSRGRSAIGGELPIDESFYDANSVFLDVEILTKALRRSSRAGPGLMDEVIDTASSLTIKHGTGWQLCRGHDLTAMLAMHVSTGPGARTVKQYEIEEDLRMACELETIRSTRFGARLMSIGQSTGKPVLGVLP